MKIEFIKEPFLPRDMAHLGYKKGQVVDLVPALCTRWLNRGVAKIIEEAEKIKESKSSARVTEAKVELEPEESKPETKKLDIVDLNENTSNLGSVSTEGTVSTSGSARLPRSIPRI